MSRGERERDKLSVKSSNIHVCVCARARPCVRMFIERTPSLSCIIVSYFPFQIESIIIMLLLLLLLPSLCFFLSAPLSAYGDDILKYTIDEKLPVHTFVADLSNFQLNGFSALHDVLPMHRNLFTMDNQTGHLLTRSILDRDDLCAKKQCSCLSCEIYLVLRSYTQNRTSNRIIEIRIKDRNDHVPTFDEPSMIHRLDIKENVPLGYRIVLPSANDPDEGTLLTLSICLCLSRRQES